MPGNDRECVMARRSAKKRATQRWCAFLKISATAPEQRPEFLTLDIAALLRR
jgi:hypothetical protein